MAYQRQTFKDNETILTASMLNHIEDGIYNVEQNILNKAELNSDGVIKSEHLPLSLLTQENLPATINAALAQAKASGEFKGDPGEPGETPVRGTHYWTDTDKAEIKAYIDEKILGGEW